MSLRSGVLTTAALASVTISTSEEKKLLYGRNQTHTNDSAARAKVSRIPGSSWRFGSINVDVSCPPASATRSFDRRMLVYRGEPPPLYAHRRKGAGACANGPEAGDRSPRMT